MLVSLFRLMRIVKSAPISSSRRTCVSSNRRSARLLLAEIVHVQARDLCLSMSLPEWNTHSAFMTEGTRTFASAPELSLDGSYRFYSSAQPDNVEKLTLNIRVRLSAPLLTDCY